MLLAAVSLCPAQSKSAGPEDGQKSGSGSGAGTDLREFDATGFGEQVILGPEWLFSPGDNVAWSAPGLDDSGWKRISAARPIADYGFHDLRHGWYRIHIHVRPGAREITIGVRGIRGSYEIYANGLRVGAAGEIAGVVIYNRQGLTAYAIPADTVSQDGRLTLAIRVAFNASGPRGRGSGTPIDFASEIALIDEPSAEHEAAYIDVHNTADSLVMASVSLLVGVVALALFGAMRTRREYLAAATALLAHGMEAIAIIWSALEATTFTSSLLRYVFLAVGNVALIEFVRMVVRQPRTRWLLLLEAVAGVGTFFALLAILGYGSLYFAFVVFFLPQLLVDGVLTWLLVRGSLQGILEARVLLPSMLLLGLTRLTDFVRFIAFFAHVTVRPIELPVLVLGSFSFDIFSISELLFYITILLFLVIRTVGIARERQRIASEFEAARTVQQVLVPEAFPTVPGFTIQSVYRPFGEVGGDFFQILPIAGGVLAVIGDVSGKGMPAAMTVSLLVGTVRTLAHYTHSPAEILAAMNERMIGRSNGGFTTCLVLRANLDGMLTVANAGHISPYLAGRELVVESGLPLGLASGVGYNENVFDFAVGEQLTLVTDGVVEARDESGELLGFERMAKLSGGSAEAIVQAAQAFGQDDDITVLTLMR